jgi:hypothetical protein
MQHRAPSPSWTSEAAIHMTPNVDDPKLINKIFVLFWDDK